MNAFFSLVFKGLLALLPIIILAWIIKLTYGFISSIVYDIFLFTHNDWLATAIVCVLMLIIFFLLGYIVERNKETIFLTATELIIGKIPVIASIYSTLKEAVNLFSGKNTEHYLGVVYVKISDYKIMGFVTKELEDSYWVFIPTTPNPTSGFLINAKKDSVEKTDLSVANGFKRLVSLGLK